MKKVVLPNYERSTLNNMASVMKHYGVDTIYNSLPEVDAALKKNYKNIVFMVCDGLGLDMLNKNLATSEFLHQHLATHVTTVFPSTTTAAMTAYYAGISPNEHGWLGWSLYFKEYGRCIDTFLNTDSYTGEAILGESAADSLMPYDHVLDKIEVATHNKVTTYMIQPHYLTHRGKGACFGYESEAQMCDKITELCADENHNFIFVYDINPDKIMHPTGCYSPETKEALKKINDYIKKIADAVEDTLIIVSADHGLLNIKETLALNEYPDIDECFYMPPCVEKRAVSCFVKPEMRDVFKDRFEKHFGEQFILFTREEVFEKQLLGYGTPHPKTKDFIGDFLACAIGDIMLDYVPKTANKKLELAGMHAGLTFEEMVVPVIMVDKK
ncbi:MAG TPA: phosphodiesterase [Firmicutes bacterium]|nr:phosphodiesterase [Bacillota bacterium]